MSINQTTSKYDIRTTARLAGAIAVEHMADMWWRAAPVEARAQEPTRQRGSKPQKPHGASTRNTREIECTTIALANSHGACPCPCPASGTAPPSLGTARARSRGSAHFLLERSRNRSTDSHQPSGGRGADNS